MPCFLLLVVIVPFRLFALGDRKRRRSVGGEALLTSEVLDVGSGILDGDSYDTIIDAIAGNDESAHLGKMDEFLALRICSRNFHFSKDVVPSTGAVFMPIWQARSSSGEDPSPIIVPIPFTAPYN